MPNRIKADSASGLQLISDSSDEIQIQSGSDTVAIVNSSGITMGSGKNLVQTNAPAFSVYTSSDQSISNSTETKVVFDLEEFDTNNCFDNVTNYRFTPTVAGYYQINATINTEGSTSATRAFTSLYKNGTSYKRGYDNTVTISRASVFNSLVYLNGSTDYIEMYIFITATSAQVNQNPGTPILTYFSGHLVRAV